MPADWTSGFYAARMRAPGAVGYVPFFVRPPRGTANAPIALVASTATYMSYANTHIKFDSLNTENLYESLTPISEDELYLNEHRELGLSHYDTHADGSGVFYASRLRPMLNFRPGLYTFNYLNDTHVVAWLAARGFECDVITDEDIHEEGAALLARYRVVITGSHPEYTSTRMWDAFDAYQRAGGRHMYLGGNGFYWRIAFSDELPGVIENRRGITGVRTWEGEPGEHHLSFTGEPGGLWRSNGRPPQRLVGVGFSATIFNRSTYYRRTEAGRDRRYAFVFEGIGDDERIGDFGLRGGGAVGMEIDRWDPDLGAPPNSVVLAIVGGRRDRRAALGRGVRDHHARPRRPPAWPGARRHGVLRDPGGRCGLVDRLHRLGDLACQQRLREQRLAHHRERAPTLSGPAPLWKFGRGWNFDG